MDEEQVKEQIKELRKQAKEAPQKDHRQILGRAYNCAQAARREGLNVDWELSWVMYDLLVDELDREQDGNGRLVSLAKILTQCQRLGLFDPQMGNYLFWKNLQSRLANKAWELAKQDQAADLVKFMITISPSLDDLFTVNYALEPQDHVYLNVKSNERGMTAVASTMTSAMTVAMRRSEDWSALLANMLVAQGALARSIRHNIGNQALASRAWELEKADDQAGLRAFWSVIQPFVSKQDIAFEVLFTPFYVGLYKHHPDQLAQNGRCLMELIATLGIKNLSHDDYQATTNGDQSYPSLADNVADLYLALNKPQLPLTDQFKQLLDQRVIKQVLSREWDAAKSHDPQQLVTTFADTKPLLSQADYHSQTGSLLLPYYLGLYQQQKDQLDRYAATLEQVIEFFGFDHFSESDRQEKESDSGHILPSLAEKIVSAYVKALLITGARDEQVTLAQHGLTILKDQTTNRDWIVYQLGKLLDQRGQLAQLNDELLAAVKHNQRNTYFWSMLAARYRDDDRQNYQAALMMAVSLPNARLADIATLITLLADQEAQRPLVKGLVQLAKATVRAGQQLPAKINQVVAQDWYQSTSACDDVTTTLQDQAKPALGEILYVDVTPAPFFVCWNNQEKNSTGIIPVTTGSVMNPPIHLHDQALTQQVMPGKFYQARIVINGKHHDYYGQLQSYQPTDEVKMNYILPFNGERLDRNERHGFGFLHFLHSDCFVPDNVVSQHQLHNGDLLSGVAQINWNSKKETWGWQLAELNKVEPATEKQVTGTFEYQTIASGRILGFVVLPDGQKALVPEEFLEASEYDDNQDVVAKVAYHWNRKRAKWDLRVTKIAPADVGL
ncbi:MAG: DUF7017 domain-containing protein [Limosilactobacillus pontis]|uniref:TOTE conflict systems S1/CSD-like domain-containing protein n=1 Tax=Limosilactobacillus pontis TaxID=35787 RepID=A0A2J6NPV0_9LACO|nr:hypothetical protein [Limosilactobacillus pontis]PMB83339.1 hypothetical protein CK797_00655 [Limosilactobacillus pontis]